MEVKVNSQSVFGERKNILVNVKNDLGGIMMLVDRREHAILWPRVLVTWCLFTLEILSRIISDNAY